MQSISPDSGTFKPLELEIALQKTPKNK